MVFGRSPKQPIDFQIPPMPPDLMTASAFSYLSALKETLQNAHDDARDQLRTAQHYQKEYYDKQVNAERCSVNDRMLVYDPVNRGFPKFLKHFVGPYVVAAKPIANGVTFILRSLDNGNIVYVHRNPLKKCIVTFSEHQAVDILMDQFAVPPEQPAQNLQVVDAAANVNPQAPLRRRRSSCGAGSRSHRSASACSTGTRCSTTGRGTPAP